jgi:hypothetical protein
MPAGADGEAAEGAADAAVHAEREQAADEDTSESFRSGHWGIAFPKRDVRCREDPRDPAVGDNRARATAGSNQPHGRMWG